MDLAEEPGNGRERSGGRRARQPCSRGCGTVPWEAGRNGAVPGRLGAPARKKRKDSLGGKNKRVGEGRRSSAQTGVREVCSRQGLYGAGAEGAGTVRDCGDL